MNDRKLSGQFLAGNGWSCKFMHGMRIHRPQTCDELRIAANPQCMSIFSPLFSKDHPEKNGRPKPISYGLLLNTHTLGCLRGRDLPPFSAINKPICEIGIIARSKSAEREVQGAFAVLPFCNAHTSMVKPESGGSACVLWAATMATP